MRDQLYHKDSLRVAARVQPDKRGDLGVAYGPSLFGETHRRLEYCNPETISASPTIVQQISILAPGHPYSTENGASLRAEYTLVVNNNVKDRLIITLRAARVSTNI